MLPTGLLLSISVIDDVISRVSARCGERLTYGYHQYQSNLRAQWGQRPRLLACGPAPSATSIFYPHPFATCYDLSLSTVLVGDVQNDTSAF